MSLQATESYKPLTRLQAYIILKRVFGEQDAEALVSFVQSEVEAQSQNHAVQKAAIITKNISVLREHKDGKSQHINEKFAIKEDLSNLRADIKKLFKQQFWLIIVMFLPLYIMMLALIFNLIK